MQEEVLGSGISQEVLKQLKARETLFKTQQRSKSVLTYLNSNTTWVKLQSSVNTLSSLEIQKILDEKNPAAVQGCHELATENILGEHKDRRVLNTQKYHDPTKKQGKFSIKARDRKSATYNNYQSLGFRPKPGITGLSLKSKNTYGTLREAEVSIQAWTLEDLEVLEALYFRPGYSVLLEWGHTLWIDPEDTTIRNITYSFDDFTKGKIKHKDIYKAIKKLRVKSNNNYDAMFGYITNFSWSYRADGGYDCTVKIISRGSILESMSFTFDPTKRIDSDQFRSKNEDKEKAKKEKSSVLHKFAIEASNTQGIMDFKKQDLDEKYAKSFRSELLDFTGVKVHIEEAGSHWFNNDDLHGIYIPMYTLLDLYNKFLAPFDHTKKDQPLLQFYTGETDKNNTSSQYEKKLKYNTSTYHFSIDPIICILPKTPGQYQYRDADGEVNQIRPGELKRNDWHKIYDELFKKNQIRGSSDDILNIPICMNWVLTKIDSIIENSETPSKGFTYLIKELLQDMNDCLGGVNELDLHYEEEDNMYYIVDRSITPGNSEKIPKLNLTGLESTLTDLKVQSKVSPDIASMVSIAAQGVEGDYKDGISALLKWNRGLIDRHIPTKTTGGSPESGTVNNSQQNDVKRLSSFFEDLEDVFNEFAGTVKPFSFGNDYDRDGFSELKAYHKEFTNKHVCILLQDERGIQGLIPIELSFTMVGIAGLKIGQTFRVNRGIVPSKYDKNFGYIITGLSHNFDNNRWTTSVKTQFFPLKN